jgi:hypothetical protein
VDFSRISFGELLAGGSALALLLIMFLPWYGGEQTVRLPGGREFSAASGHVNAWESFGLIDLVLCLVIALAVGFALARAADAAPAEPPLHLALTAAGTLAVLLILYRLIDPPGLEPATEGDVARRIGIFLALVAAAGISAGGYTALVELSGPPSPSGGRSGRR